MAYVLKGSRGQTLFSTTWGFFIGFAAVVLFAPLISALGLSPQEKALLLGISSLTGSLLRIPFAAWVDTTGGRTPFLVLLLMSVVGMFGIYLLLGGTPEAIRADLGWLLFFGALAGCGIATFSVGIGQTSYWFPQKGQGRALALYAGMGNLAPGVFGFVISNFLIKKGVDGQVLMSSIRNIYLIWLVFLLIGTAVYLLTTNNAWYFQARKQGASPEEAKKVAGEKGQELFPKGNVIASLVNAAKVWQNWVFVFVYFLSFGGFLALTNWFRLMFKDYHGLTVAAAASFASLYSIGASLARVATGPIADKFDAQKLVNGLLLLTAFGALIIIFTDTKMLHIVGLLCMMLGMGGVNAGVFKLVPRYIPHAVGGAAGWIGGLGGVGGFVLPLILSLLLTGSGAQDIGYRNGFWIFVGLSVVSLLLMSLVARAGKKEK